jgi:predicted PurR-regulated permease PerM
MAHQMPHQKLQQQLDQVTLRVNLEEAAVPMRDSASNSTRWALALAVVSALVLAYWLRIVLLPFVAAGALAYVSRPLLTLFRRLHLSPWAVSLIPLVLFLLLLSALGYAIKATLAPEMAEMINNLPRVVAGVLDNLLVQVHLKDVPIFGRKVDSAAMSAQLIASLKQNVSGNLGPVIGGAFGAMMGGVLTVVLFAFILFSGPRLANGLLWLIPPDLRPRSRALALEIDSMLAGYLRGIFLVVLFTSCVTYLAMGLVFHIHGALFLALAVGLLELLPVIGPALSFAAFGLVAVQQTSIETIMAFGIFAIALRLAIDQVVGPLVLGRAADIPAVVVIFAFMAGGALYGMLGVILAIPVAATVKIVLTDLYRRRALRESGGA